MPDATYGVATPAKCCIETLSPFHPIQLCHGALPIQPLRDRQAHVRLMQRLLYSSCQKLYYV
jgi:hypothetical protein